MSLSINPFAKLVASISEGISKATNEGQAALQAAASSISKEDLDQRANELAAGIDSGLNGLSGNQQNFGDTALGGNSTISSSARGAVDKLRTTAGSTSNITADIAMGINKLTGGSLGGGLMKLAGNISKSAGMLNNLLSLKRGANLPSGANSILTQGTPIKILPGDKNDWRVRLTCQWNVFNSPMFKVLEDTGGVVWPYMPNITVSTKADYTAVTPTHSNYGIYSYKNSVIDDIQISGEFSCETSTDAAYWIAATTFFKTATKMFFGQGDYAGNPPIICHLKGYGDSVFPRVPVIIKAFSVDLKEDVNYINCDRWGTNTWVPVLSTISVTVAPVYNRTMLRQFSLQEYAKGSLKVNEVGYL